MIQVPVTRRLLRGLAELERVPRGLRPHRLPAAVRARDADPQLSMVEAQPAGARLELLTASTEVELELHATRTSFVGFARPRGAVDLVVDGVRTERRELDGGDLVEIDLATGVRTTTGGAPSLLAFGGLPPGKKRVELWLPHDEAVDVVALRTSHPVEPVPEDRPRWLHHGSSISQGSNAGSPADAWPAVAARASGADLRNLGFGGSAMVDPFVARLLRDTEADVISVKLGINVVGGDVMRMRAFVPAVHGFLDTIREGHPTTPLLLVSPIFCGIHEDAPGPGSIDPVAFRDGELRFTAAPPPHDPGRLTLRAVRDALGSIAAQRSDDPHLSYLDGTRLYGAEDAERLPLPDALHPGPEAHRLIGERFADLAFGAEGLLADRSAPPV